MLEPIERLRIQAKSNKRRPIAYTMSAVVICELIAIIYFAPSLAAILFLACVATVFFMVVLLLVLAIGNELSWLIWGKRF